MNLHPFPGQPSAVGIKLARMRSIKTPFHTSCTSRPLLWPACLPACTGSSILHQDLGPHPSFHPSDCKRIAQGLPPGCPPRVPQYTLRCTQYTLRTLPLPCFKTRHWLLIFQEPLPLVLISTDALLNARLIILCVKSALLDLKTEFMLWRAGCIYAPPDSCFDALGPWPLLLFRSP